MKKNKAKSSRKVKKIHFFRSLFSFIILAVIIFFSSKAVLKLIENPTNTVILKQGKITKEESVNGYIIRNEIVVRGENYKNGMEKIAEEGSKIAKEESIFRYYSSGEDSLLEKMKELDEQIEEAMKKNENDLFSSDIKMLDSQINQEIIKLNSLTSMQEILEVKKNLNNYITKKAKIAGEYSPSGSFLNKLINERSELEKELFNGSEYVKAPSSGIVSYRVDGLEELLLSNDFSKYNKEFLNNLNLKSGQIIPASEEQGKVIDNFNCYIVFTSKTQEAINSKIGDGVKIVLPSGRTIKATIQYKIDENENEVTIVVHFTEGIEELSMYRKNSFDIIWWNEEGYKIPNSCLIEESNLYYVNRTKLGHTEKVLVKVKKQGEDYSIITNYSTSELNELSIDKNISTSILLYDEIILKPNKDENIGNSQ